MAKNCYAQAIKYKIIQLGLRKEQDGKETRPDHLLTPPSPPRSSALHLQQDQPPSGQPLHPKPLVALVGAPPHQSPPPTIPQRPLHSSAGAPLTAAPSVKIPAPTLEGVLWASTLAHPGL
ncbi:hypothetical protein C0989_006016, partial [Termitomyces sp. Mn162]